MPRVPEQTVRARGPRGGRTTAISRWLGETAVSRMVLLAPLPNECKPGIGP